MANILVRNIDEDTHARLKARALRESRSVSDILRELIERNADPAGASQSFGCLLADIPEVGDDSDFAPADLKLRRVSG